MIKAVREAKVHTSWVKRNEGYEEAVRHFVGVLLGRLTANPFLSDLLDFHGGIYRYGLYNSLAQVVLKLTVPGVPDIYQGNELWCFNLVDPDNRRPVDYEARGRLLDDLREILEAPVHERVGRVAALQDTMEDGRLKLYLTRQLLRLRRDRADLFHGGDYVPLQAEGDKAEHLCAFMRGDGRQTVMVVVPRWFYKLCADSGSGPSGPALWRGTSVEASGMAPGMVLTNIFTGEAVVVQGAPEAPRVMAQDLFGSFPFAVCVPGPVGERNEL